MLKLPFLHAASLMCAWLALSPAAQAAEPTPTIVPAQTAADAPFDQYKSWRDVPVRDWREANGRVNEVGGWRTYLREAQQDGNDANRHQH